MANFALHLQASGLAEHEQDLFVGSLGKYWDLLCAIQILFK